MQKFTNLFRTEGGKLIRLSDGKCDWWIGTNGYYNFDVEGKSYLVHRMIFLLEYGFLPDLVDHKDRDKLNNLPSNLREADKSLNMLNTELRADNKSGCKGVNKVGRKWAVRYKGKYMGTKETYDEAVAYRESLEIH